MIQFIDTFHHPQDHLALDEAMLVQADASESPFQGLRIWEFSQPTAVVGRSTRVEDELDIDYCNAHSIPIFRRCSGGASVIGGPGCLMYSLVLSLDQTPELRKIDAAHEYVMSRVLTACQQQLPEVQLQGICDLTWKNRKFSGNSLRIARQHLLYHGTILYDFDLDMIARCLKTAPRQPEYRGGRDHAEFVTNAPIAAQRFAHDLGDAFDVSKKSEVQPFFACILELRKQRYDSKAWNFRH